MSLRVSLVDCEGDGTTDEAGDVCGKEFDCGRDSSLMSCFASFWFWNIKYPPPARRITTMIIRSIGIALFTNKRIV